MVVVCCGLVLCVGWCGLVVGVGVGCRLGMLEFVCCFGGFVVLVRCVDFVGGLWLGVVVDVLLVVVIGFVCLACGDLVFGLRCGCCFGFYVV